MVRAILRIGKKDVDPSLVEKVLSEEDELEN